MSEYLIREYKVGDSPTLINIWHQVFGDPEPLISDFLQRLPQMGTAAVAHLDGEPVGAAYALDCTLRSPNRPDTSCGYLYAVAVSPLHRHNGLGAELSRFAAQLSYCRGAEFITTLPAETSLYPWYEEILGISCALRRSTHAVPAAELLPCRKITAAEYAAKRELLLQELPHLSLCQPAMDFAQVFYDCFGGGLFACGDCLCAAYADSKQVLIKELLSPSAQSDAVAASLAAALGCERAVYFLPDPDGEVYISAPLGALPSDCVWNLSFD